MVGTAACCLQGHRWPPVTPASRYYAEINLRHPNDPRVAALGRVPARSRVLDLGMADGSLARVLTAMGCTVTGVDIDAEAVAAAAEVVDDAILADLGAVDLPTLLGGRRFDVVLALDVLEHLSDPVSVLRSMIDVVADEGWAVLSIPNVSHISVRMDLLRGRFTYRDTGLLDRTHLRFFDRAGLDALLDQAGWVPIDHVQITREYGETEITADPELADLARDVAEEPDALTYQFVVVAVPEGSPVLSRPPVLPAAEAQSTLLEAVTYIRHLESELAALTRIVPPDLGDMLESIRVGSINRRQSLRDLLVAVQENTKRMSQYI